MSETLDTNHATGGGDKSRIVLKLGSEIEIYSSPHRYLRNGEVVPEEFNSAISRDPIDGRILVPIFLFGK